MSLEVGVDTYISEADATTMLSKYFLATDPPLIQWLAMAAADREIFLRRAFARLEILPYRGKKYSATQALKFPRTDNNMNAIKYAQTLQALSYTDSVTQDESAYREMLRASGVIQYQIGNLKEQFGSTARSVYNGVAAPALAILQPYLTGGFAFYVSKSEHCL